MPELKIDIRVDSADGEKKLKSLGDTMDKAGKAGKKGMDDAAGSLGGLKKQTDSAGGGLDGLKKRFDTASSAASAFKGLLGAAGVLGALDLMVGGFTSAVKIGANFEQQMATVGGVMRASQADMAKLTAAARQMGETTEWSATQSAEALQYLGMAGFNATDAIKALPGMLDLATAGQLDLGKAADIATDGLTAMGMSVDQLGRFNDVLVGTITRSNTNIEQMGYSLKYVAPVASQMGYSIEQVSAAIGVMANAGLKGEMAGTGLSAVFLKLDKASKELGISSNRLPDVMKAIADAQWDATKIAKVFGEEQVKSVMVLKNGLGTYRDLEKQLQNTGGESKALADTMRSTTMGAFKELLSIIEDYGITGFERYKDKIKSSLTEAAGFLRTHKEDVFNALSGIESAITKTNSAMALLSGRTLTQAVIGDLTQSAEQGKAVVIQLGEEYKRQYDAHMGLLANSQAQKNAAAIEDIKRAEAAAAEQVKVQETAVKKIAKASEDHAKSEKKHIDDRLRAEKKAADDRERAYDQMYRDLGQQADGWKRHEIANLEKQRDAFIKATGDKELAYKWFAAEIQKIEDDLTKKLKDEEEKRQKASEDALKERSSAYDRMFSDLGVKASSYRDHELAILGQQRDDFIKHTGDKQLAYQWYADQVKALDKGIADEMRGNAEANVGSWAWFEAEAGKAMQAIADNGRSALSDGLFSLLKGDMDSLGDAWKGLWDDMLRVMSDIMARMLVEYAISGLGNLFGLTGPSAAGSVGGGIAGSIAGTAASQGIGAAYSAAKGWITGGGALAAGAGAAAGGAFLGGSTLATDLYLGTGALVDAGGAAAAGASGSGMLGSLGALATNPWTWAAAGALVAGGLIARNNMQPEKRESIDPTDFGWYDPISLNHSADNGGGNAEYGALANQAASDAQRDMARLAAQYKASMPDDLENDFQSRLSAMSVHLGGGGMKIREDHLADDLQVMYRGTLYAMMFDTLDPIYQTLQQYQARYGVDAGAHMQSNRQLWNRFATFDPEGFWTGSDRALFDEYYSYLNNVQAFNTAVSARQAGGYASGGVIDRLIVPRGEDGFAAVQYGEGVVSKGGMQALEAINAGLTLQGGARPINITIPIDIGGDIKTYVVKVADDHRVKVSSRPGMERRRSVR